MDNMDTLAERASSMGPDQDEGPWSEWKEAFGSFQEKYRAATERSSSHAEKLAQLKRLEARVSELNEETTRTRDTLTTLGTAEENYDAAWSAWVAAQQERDGLIDRECAKLTERSGDLIQVSVKRFSDASVFVETLRGSLQGSRVQAAKLEALGVSITSSDDPRATWAAALSDLEELAAFDGDNSTTDARPAALTLVGLGMSQNDVDRIASHLSPEDWLTLALTPIESAPVYGFRAREDEYIPFKNASAGQQATALLC